MPVTPEQETDLRALRIAAQQRQWNTMQDTLKRLLAGLEPLVALGVAAERVRDFLPVFEREYPEADWVRELALTVISYASAPRDLPVHAVNQFPRPGCGNFIMAVFDLARAVQPEYTVFERYSHITNSVANVILAELQHTYFSAHPGVFAALRNPDASQQAITQAQQSFWIDAATGERDTALWLQVADAVEALLRDASGGV